MPEEKNQGAQTNRFTLTFRSQADKTQIYPQLSAAFPQGYRVDGYEATSNKCLIQEGSTECMNYSPLRNRPVGSISCERKGSPATAEAWKLAIAKGDSFVECCSSEGNKCQRNWGNGINNFWLTSTWRFPEEFGGAWVVALGQGGKVGRARSNWSIAVKKKSGWAPPAVEVEKSKHTGAFSALTVYLGERGSAGCPSLALPTGPTEPDRSQFQSAGYYAKGLFE